MTTFLSREARRRLLHVGYDHYCHVTGSAPDFALQSLPSHLLSQAHLEVHSVGTADSLPFVHAFAERQHLATPEANKKYDCQTGSPYFKGFLIWRYVVCSYKILLN